MSHPHRRESLLTQLENMHKQLNDETKKKSSHSNGSDNTGAPFGTLSRHERNSMPMFAGSSSHSGLLASNNNQDMTFVMGLSENLLVECRRLQADNETKKRKLQTAKQSNEEIKEKFRKLNNTHQAVVKELQSLRDVNWELEDKVQNLSVESTSLKEKLSKNNRKLKQESEAAIAFKTDLEVSELKLTNLEAQINAAKNQHVVDLTELKKHISELNDENDTLNLKNREMHEQLEKSGEMKNSSSAKIQSIQHDLESANSVIAHLKEQLGAVSSANTVKNVNVSTRDKKEYGNGLNETPSAESRATERAVSEDQILEQNAIMSPKDGSREETVTQGGSSGEENIQNEVANQKNSSEVNGNIESMTDSLRSVGYTVVLTKDYSEMLAKLRDYDNPSDEYSKVKAKSLGKRLVPHETLKQLSNPPLASVINRLEEKGFKVLGHDDHLELMRKIEDPSLEYLQNKLKLHDRISITSEENSQLRAPGFSIIAEHARRVGYTIISDETYNQIEKDRTEPSLDYLKELVQRGETKQLLFWLADKQGTVLLSKKEFEKLESCSTAPTLEFLGKKAASLDYHLMPNEKLVELKRALDTPSIDYLKEKADINGLSIISSVERAELVRISEAPDLSFLSEKAQILGHRLVTEDDFKMLESYRFSSLDFLKEKAAEKDHEVIDKCSHQTLIQISMHPSLEFLQEKAAHLGYELVEQGKLEELQRKILRPSQNELSRMARDSNCVVISASDHNKFKRQLKNPSREYLDEKSQEKGLVLMTAKELKELKSTTKDRTKILSLVKSFGFAPIPVPELQALRRSSISNASISDLKTKLQGMGFFVVAKQEYEHSRNVLSTLDSRDSLENLRTQCAKYDLIALPLSEYESLKSNKREELTLEDLLSALQSYGYAIVAQSIYEQLKVQLNIFDPNSSATDLQEGSMAARLVIISKDRHDELQRAVNSPSRGFIESKAQQLGLLALDPQRLGDELSHMDSCNNNSLPAKIQELGYKFIKEDKLKEMERKLARPSLAELGKFASNEGLVMIEEEELLQIKERLKNPSIEDLKTKTLRNGYIMILIAEYEFLQREHVTPSEAFLAEKALGNGKILVDKTFYETLQSQLDKPSEKYLAEHATLFGKVLVSKSSYDETLKMVATPTKEFLAQKAAHMSLVLLDSEEVKNLKRLENMLEKAGLELSSTEVDDLLPRSLEASMQKKEKGDSYCPSDDENEGSIPMSDEPLDIARMIKKGSFVLLDKSAYQSMLDACIKRVTKREVVNICHKFDMIALPSKKYDELIQDPTLGEIRSLAARHASIVVTREQFDMLQAEVEHPTENAIQRSMAQKGMVPIEKSEYDSLLLKSNSPSKIEVEKQAKKLGLIAIPVQKYEHLLKDLESKSLSTTPSPSSKVLASKQFFENVIQSQNKQSDRLHGPTKTLGFVSLSSEEYKKLKESQKSYTITKADIYKGAKAFSLAVLPLEEYKALLKKKLVSSPFEYDNLEDSAARQDVKVVPVYMSSPTPRSRKSVENNRNNSLKFHDHPCVTPSDHDVSDDVRLNSEVDEARRQSTVSLTTSPQFTDHLDDNIQNHSPNEDEVSSSPIASTVCSQGGEPNKATLDLDQSLITATKGLTEPLLDEQQQVSEQLVKNEVFVENGYSLDQKSQQIPELADSCSPHDQGDLSEDSDLDEETLVKEAKKKDLVLLPRADYEQFLAAAKVTTITRENLDEEACKMNLVTLDKQEYAELVAKSEIDARRVKEMAPQFGLKAVSEDYLEDLKTQITKEQLTVENVKKRVADLGYVALSVSEFEALRGTSVSKRSTRAQELAESTVPPELEPKSKERNRTSETSEDKGTKSETIPAVRTPLSPTSTDSQHCSLEKDPESNDKEMPPNVTVDDIVRWSSNFKLVPIELEQFEQIKEELSNPTLTDEEIIEQARKHRLVVVPEDVYEQLQSTSKDAVQHSETTKHVVQENYESSEDMAFDKALSHLKEIANRFGLFRSPEDPSEAEKLSGAQNVVIISSEYYSTLLEKKKMLAIKVAQEQIRAKNERLASKISPTKAKSHQPSQPPPGGLLKSERQKSMSSPKSPVKSAVTNASKAHMKFTKSASHSAGFKPKHSRGSSLARNDSTAASLVGRSNSMGALSLATVASLSEPSIIPALTQTVIGEYLHKYYSYFGPFGLNSRHERFFWVHPYTLTLYWSTTNPVLSNPANHKTKCAAIISVESIVDTNPYPAGLYHKSIIVTSDKKTIKITCATRQRHNIWFNSLRYLVQRSMEGINLEDIADDPGDTLYSGKIFPLPGENSKSANQRLSSTRKSARARMPNSTSMPIKKSD